MTGAHFLAEVIATAGLILVIFALARTGRARSAPAAAGAYIGTHAGLVAEQDHGAFGSGSAANFRVNYLLPLFSQFRLLFIGSVQRLLGR